MNTISTVFTSSSDMKMSEYESSNETYDLNSNSESKSGKTTSILDIENFNADTVELINDNEKTYEENKKITDVSENDENIDPDFPDSNTCYTAKVSDSAIPRIISLPYQEVKGTKCFYTVQKQTLRSSPTHDCSICGQQFIYNSSLKSHVETVHSAKINNAVAPQKKRDTLGKNQIHTCTTCGKVFTNMNNMKTHIEAFHRRNTFDCLDCRRKFKKCDDLVVHRYAYHCGQMYTCKNCNRKFDDKRNLKNHCDKCYGKPPLPVSCKVCGNKLSKKAYLKTHITVAHTTVCQNNFIKKSDLVKHTEDNHKTFNNKLLCTMCKKVFSNKPNRDAHMIIHQKINANIFPCMFCDKKFKRKNDHYFHIHLKHNENQFNKSKITPSKKNVCPNTPKLKITEFAPSEKKDQTISKNCENYSKRRSRSKTRNFTIKRCSSYETPFGIFNKKLVVLHLKMATMCNRSEVGVIKRSTSNIVLPTPLEGL